MALAAFPAFGEAQPSADSQSAGFETVVDTIIGRDRLFIISTDSLINNDELRQLTDGVDFATDSVIRVEVVGRASIDGPMALNEKLAKARTRKIKNALVDFYAVDESKITANYIGEDWTVFKNLIEEDTSVPNRVKILEIIESDSTPSSKERSIKRLGTDTWRYLADNTLPRMRSASIEWQVARRIPLPVPELPQVVEPEEVIEVVEEVATVVEVPAVVEDDWYRKMYIKTNAPAWAMAWVNAAVEFDLAQHWSASLPFYWAGWDYFKRDLKFRTFAFVPEVRFWPKKDNTGFFVNAHFGVAYYNYAKQGEYRYQDHGGHTPALGGGVGIGYRFYFCKNKRWTIEAAVGAGVYRLDYDLFLNYPNGPLVGREKHTFFGIDQAALTFSYSFGLRKARKEVAR